LPYQVQCETGLFGRFVPTRETFVTQLITNHGRPIQSGAGLRSDALE